MDVYQWNLNPFRGGIGIVILSRSWHQAGVTGAILSAIHPEHRAGTVCWIPCVSRYQAQDDFWVMWKLPAQVSLIHIKRTSGGASHQNSLKV